MKKNNKGFFLAETIVVIALVTTIMAYVFPNVSNLYDNYNNRIKYYDQAKDLYALRAIAEYFETKSYFEDFTGSYTVVNSQTVGFGCFEFRDAGNNEYVEDVSANSAPLENSYAINLTRFVENGSFEEINELKELYFTGYMTTLSSSDFNFNRYLKRVKKTTNDTSAYRLIGVFETKDEDGNTITRYASIKIQNPNDERSCNLGSEE